MQAGIRSEPMGVHPLVIRCLFILFVLTGLGSSLLFVARAAGVSAGAGAGAGISLAVWLVVSMLLLVVVRFTCD
jgi:hypothetical protein